MHSSAMEPVTPGEILLEEFLKPLGISQNKLARDINVSPPTINALVRGKRAVTTDMAIRLGEYFGVEPQSWLNLQNNHDLQKARQSKSWERIKAEIRQQTFENPAATSG